MTNNTDNAAGFVPVKNNPGDGGGGNRDIRRNAYGIIADRLSKAQFKERGNVSFEIRPGDFVYIVGKSGSGKSTLLEMLCGYNKKISGTLSFINEAAQYNEAIEYTWQDDDLFLKSIIGYVPQENSLYDDLTPVQILTTYYNALHNEHSTVGIEGALDAVELNGRVIHTKIGKLSGGEKKRVSIAIELLKISQLKLLILDEPDSGLDPYNRNILYKLLRKFNGDGMTIIVASHYFEQKYGDDLIIYLEKDLNDSVIGRYLDVKGEVNARNSEAAPAIYHRQQGFARTVKIPAPAALFSRDIKMYFSDKRNLFFILLAPFICKLLFSANTDASTFSEYRKGLPIVFAVSCAAILLGLTLSVNMVCRNSAAVKREIRKGISKIFIILSKTFLLIILCAVMSLIITIPYGMDIKIKSFGADAGVQFFATVFIIMLASAELGLAISCLPGIKPQTAVNTTPIIMIFQIMFSGYLFADSDSLINDITFSNYAIKALGGALGFDSFMDAPYGFGRSLSHNMTYPLLIFTLCFITCVMLLKFTDLD